MHIHTENGIIYYITMLHILSFISKYIYKTECSAHDVNIVGSCTCTNCLITTFNKQYSVIVS